MGCDEDEVEGPAEFEGVAEGVDLVVQFLTVFFL